MSLYIQQLEAHAAAERERQSNQAQQAELVAVEDATGRLTPLPERLARLLAQIPDSVQRSGLGVAELQRLVRGRQGRQAHQGEIAAALRSLGWSSKRSWKRDSPDGFKSRWFPPPGIARRET